MSEWFLGLDNPALIHGILFGLLILGAIGFPIPEDLPLIFGGIVAHSGNVKVTTTIAVCYAGVLFGDLLIFSIGRRLGPALFEKPWFKKRIGPRRVKHLRLRLERRSLWMIFIARHLFFLEL